MLSGRFGFRHLATVTAALTFALILLGVYTGAVGAGLTCGARWPFCNGWLGLFPANWPSFVEWFHRLVAMITGGFIVGTAYVAWRDGHARRIKIATLVATVLLPVQILLGANTVLNFGLAAKMAHHTTAQAIFGALVAAAAWSFTERDTGTVTETETGTTAKTGAD